jgi:hypothetical protein
MLAVLISVSSFGQVTKTKNLLKKEKSRIELSFNLGYSYPLLEAYGSKVTINTNEDRILIDGKSLLVSDNFGTNTGYTVQAYIKYAVVRNGFAKILFNLGYNNLHGTYPGSSGYDVGVRIQSFSIGAGAEINPLGHDKTFYPGVYGLLRTNFMGGETFHRAGLDFFKVVPRYGYSAGFKLNYNLKRSLGMHFGYSYSYDNVWNKQTDETVTGDAHVIVFRDEANSTNGLSSNRRVAYWSLYLGMNFFFN